METVWKGRLTQAAVKYGELTPAATACCNTCRTCVTTNLITLATAAVASGAVAAAGVVKRLAGRA